MAFTTKPKPEYGCIGDDPQYKVEKDKLVDFQLQLSDTERQLGVAHSAITKDTNPVKDAAVALLEGNEPPVIANKQQEIQGLHRKRSVLNEAIKMQKQKTENTQAAINKKVAIQKRGEYAAIIDRMTKAGETLAEAMQEEQDFAAKLMDAGYEFDGDSLRRLYWGNRNPLSMIEWWKREVVEAGYATAKLDRETPGVEFTMKNYKPIKAANA